MDTNYIKKEGYLHHCGFVKNAVNTYIFNI